MNRTVGPFGVENSSWDLLCVPAALVTVVLEPASEEQKQEWELVKVVVPAVPVPLKQQLGLVCYWLDFPPACLHHKSLHFGQT